MAARDWRVILAFAGHWKKWANPARFGLRAFDAQLTVNTRKLPSDG
jgi:hypothetical protein